MLSFTADTDSMFSVAALGSLEDPFGGFTNHMVRMYSVSYNVLLYRRPVVAA